VGVTLQTLLDHAADGGRLAPEEALELYTDAPFHALGRAADAVRRARFGDQAGIATYLIDRNINYTNVCVTACKFCAFYRAPKHAEGWTHSIEEIVRRIDHIELETTADFFDLFVDGCLFQPMAFSQELVSVAPAGPRA